MINTNACFMQCLRKIKDMDIIEGISYHELSILQGLLSSIAGYSTKAIEIGSWKGCSSYFLAHILNHFKDCKLYCIDTWGGNEDTWQMEEVAQHSIRKIFDFNTTEFNHIIVPINEDSKIAHTQFEDESIDFIFTDGDHTYNGQSYDLKFYYPKLRVGGIMCGHDSNHRYESLSSESRREVDSHLNDDCVFIEALQKRVHCGVAKALYDFFGSDYKRSEEVTTAETGIKNSLWWRVK
jgi:predicted O-methyltransferase YrrM